MKSYAKKIMTRLAAGAMALLLAVGTAATDMGVCSRNENTGRHGGKEKDHRICRSFGQSERDSYDR